MPEPIRSIPANVSQSIHFPLLRLPPGSIARHQDPAPERHFDESTLIVVSKYNHVNNFVDFPDRSRANPGNRPFLWAKLDVEAPDSAENRSDPFSRAAHTIRAGAPALGLSELLPESTLLVSAQL